MFKRKTKRLADTLCIKFNIFLGKLNDSSYIPSFPMIFLFCF